MEQNDKEFLDMMIRLLAETISKEERGVVGLTTSVTLVDLKRMLGWAQEKTSIIEADIDGKGLTGETEPKLNGRSM